MSSILKLNTGMVSIAAGYISNGFALAPIKPGTKQPRGSEWQKEGVSAEHWARYPNDGMGLIHGLSDTCSIDIDNIEASRLALAAICVDMDSLLASGVQIISREGRAKLLYAAPEGLPTQRHALNWPAKDGKGGYCVIEFRAGLVQDVLPPSIHPDTGKPYLWRGDWYKLPTLPPALLGAWKEWELAKSAMMDACPWREKEITTPKRGAPQRNVSDGIIARFNDAHDAGSILEQHGYVPAGGRWLYPESTTGIPGVVLLDSPDGVQRVYSHHGSDPLSNGHAHDAFSLFCELRHSGNSTAAAADAYHILGETTPEEIAQQEMQEILDRVKPKEEAEQVVITAPDPGDMPCKVGRVLAGWLARRVPSSKRDAVTQIALAYLCFCVSRRFRTPEGYTVSAFFGVTDSSVAGLSSLKSEVYGLAARTQDRMSIRGGGIPSAGVLHSALFRSPRMLWITSEYGHMVSMSRKQQSGSFETTISALHDCHDGGTLFVDPDNGRGGGKERDVRECDIYAPSVTMVAFIADDQISALGQRSEYGRGTLQRMLIIPAGDSRHDNSETTSEEIPSVFEEAKKRMMSALPLDCINQTASTLPGMVTVSISADAAAEISRSKERMADYMAADTRNSWKGLVHGHIQTAKRIGCALAAWNNPEAPVLDSVVARWACEWVERCLMLTVPLMEVTVTDGDELDVAQRVMQVLFDKRKPMSSRDIARCCRAFRRLEDPRKIELLAGLVKDGLAVSKTAGKFTKYSAATLTK